MCLSRKTVWFKAPCPCYSQKKIANSSCPSDQDTETNGKFHHWKMYIIRGVGGSNVGQLSGERGPPMYEHLSWEGKRVPMNRQFSGEEGVPLMSPSSIPQPQGLLGHHRWLHNQFPPFFLFSTALWDLANSKPVHSHLSFCLPCLFSLLRCLARRFRPDLMNGRHVHTTSVCVSLRWSGLRVVRLPAGSWHRRRRW